MNKKSFDDGSVEIWKKNGRYFIRYDVGTHQITMREDEISEDEMKSAMHSESEMSKVLFSLQQRLENAGVDPYKSNTK